MIRGLRANDLVFGEEACHRCRHGREADRGYRNYHDTVDEQGRPCECETDAYECRVGYRWPSGQKSCPNFAG